jgi:AhpC/TSA antioxidant enzyme
MIGLTKPRMQQVHAQIELGETPPAEFFLKSGTKNLVCFLRHTGCPFAEELCKQASSISEANPELNVIVVAHGEEPIARAWFDEIKLAPSITALVDPDRDLYGRWGLGYCDASELMAPKVLWRVGSLMLKGIRNRKASGTRWQRQAVFVVDKEGRVAWRHIAGNVSDVPKIPINR